MPATKDGPATKLFKPLTLRGNIELARVRTGLSKGLLERVKFAPSGNCVARGVPLKIGKALLAKDKPVTVKLAPTKAPWLIVSHTADSKKIEPNKQGFFSPMKGHGHLNEKVADYVFIYADGSEERVAIRRRHEIGMYNYGEACFQATPDSKPRPVPSELQDVTRIAGWGRTQCRAANRGSGRWFNWLWAWENPHPRKAIVALRVEPVESVIISAISAGKASSHPLRWASRRKAMLTLPKGTKFNYHLGDEGLYDRIKLDMGAVISAVPRPLYPNQEWSRTYNNAVPEMSDRDVLIEYTAHPDANFHLPGGKRVPVAKTQAGRKSGGVSPVATASQKVTFRALEKGSKKPVAVKLHIHGQAGEYLPPNVNHRIPNPAWFQDYSVDYTHQGKHHCVYIQGEAEVRLPMGKVFVEVSKGFEIKPVRKVVNVTGATKEVVITIERVLPWRRKGWVTADTHVHFLSPPTAGVQGAAEGVNVVNLLASQWSELMTNVGDFDGKTTFGSKEAGGDGEYLVRVGTENRQHVMGHISLLGYEGNIIAPMTTAGPAESAIGDPVEVLLTEWGAQCKDASGVVIIPHFPNPRLESASVIVSGNADGVELACGGQALYNGIGPYSLSDWYRYLNCGYLVAAVGGTDKMSAASQLGAIRTYAKIDPKREFDYEAWKDAIRRAETFVTFGPLMEFAVEGKPMGSQIKMTRTGGTVSVKWQVASATVPMSRVELVVNGEIRESKAVKKWADKGAWRVNVDKSSWIALLVRGHYTDKPEIVAAHSSPVMVKLAGSPFMAAADAVTILEQIEGALAFLGTVGTRAEDKAYKRMKLVLTSAHRSLHNRMHKAGHYHNHTPVDDHAAHH